MAGKAAGQTTFDDMCKEDLVQHVKKQLMILQKSKQKIDDLNKKCASLEIECKRHGDSESGEEMKSTLESTKLERDELKANYDKLNREHDDLKRNIQDRDDQINLLAAARDEALTSLKSIKDSLKSYSEKDEESISELASIKLELEQEKSKNSRLLAENKDLEEREKSSAAESRRIDGDDSSECAVDEHVRKFNNLETTISRLNGELEASESDRERLETEVEVLGTEKEELSSRLDALEAEVPDKVTEIRQPDLEIELDDKMEQIESLTKNLEELSQSNEMLERELERKNEECRDVRSAVAKLEKKMASLSTENKELTDELGQDHELVRFLEDETKSLQEENKRIKDDLKNMEIDIDKDTMGINKLSEQLHAMQEKENAAILELEQFKERLIRSEEEKETLKEKFERSVGDGIESESESSYVEVKLSLDEAMSENESLIGEIKDLRAERDQLDGEYDGQKMALRSTIETLRKDVEILKDERNESEVDSQVPSPEVGDRCEASSINKQLENTLNEFKSKFNELQSVNGELKMQLDLLASENGELAGDVAEKVRIISSLRSRLATKESEFDPLLQRLRGIEAENGRLCADLDAVHSRCNTLSDEKEEIGRSLKSHEEKLADEEQMKRQLHHQLDALMGDIEDLASTVEDKRKNIVYLETRISSLQVEIEEKSASFDELKASGDAIRQRVSSLEDELRSKVDEGDSLKQRMSEMEAQCDSLKSAKEQLEGDVSNAEGIVGNLSEEKKQLLSKVKMHDDEKKALEDAIADIKVAMDEKESELSKIEADGIADKLKQELDEMSKEKDLRVEEVRDFGEKLRSSERLAIELQNRCSSFESMLKEKEDERDRHEKRSRDLSAKCEDSERKLREMRDGLDSNLGSCDEIRATLRQKVDELQMSWNESARLQREVDRLMEFGRQLEEDVSDANDRNTKVEEVCKGLFGTNEELAAENGKLAKEIEEFKDTIACLRNEMTKIKENYREIVVANGEAQKKRQDDGDKLSDAVDRSAVQPKVAEELNVKLQEFERGRIDESDGRPKEVSESQTCADESEIGDLRAKLKESEDKLLKVKTIAVRMKKELNETKNKLANVSDERDQLNAKVEELNHKSNSSLQYLQNYQSLQAEYDKIQDLYEDQKSVTKKFERDLETKLKELTSAKTRSTEIREERNKLSLNLERANDDLSARSKRTKELEAKIICLEEEKRQEKKQTEQIQNQLDKVNKQFEEVKRLHSAATDKLNSALQDTKQQNMIDLEIADYERTVSNLQAELRVQRATVSELDSDKKHLTERISSLREEIGCLENQKIEAEERAERIKETSDKVKLDLANVKRESTDTQRKNETLRQELERQSQQTEEFKVHISELVGDNSKWKQNIKLLKDSHQVATRTFESKISLLQEDLLRVNKEYENCQRNFECYKVRVHNVLKQQKKQTTVTSEEMQTHEHLRSIVDNLKEKLDTVSTQYSSLKLEYDAIQDEHDRLLHRHAELVEEIENVRANHRNVMNQTNQERETILVEHNNLVSNLRQENGRLSTSLKDQLESSRDNQKKMVSSLQNQLEIADLEIARLRRESRVEIGNNKSTGNVDNFVSTKEEDLVADISLQERQEGEGSENTDTVTSTPHKPSSLPLVHSSGFVPFDQLLQMPVVPASPTNSTMSSLHDAETLAGKLNGYRKKLEHLTEVLNESEATNVRLSEQTIVLKEEIRRLERNEQRRQHSDNLEYLKNIIVKFLTLPVGDERARLIPVFTTMLRLSPEEKSSLAEVAIGNSGGDVTGTSSSGWGLHLWSGLS